MKVRILRKYKNFRHLHSLIWLHKVPFTSYHFVQSQKYWERMQLRYEKETKKFLDSFEVPF